MPELMSKNESHAGVPFFFGSPAIANFDCFHGQHYIAIGQAHRPWVAFAGDNDQLRRCSASFIRHTTDAVENVKGLLHQFVCFRSKNSVLLDVMANSAALFFTRQGVSHCLAGVLCRSSWTLQLRLLAGSNGLRVELKQQSRIHRQHQKKPDGVSLHKVGHDSNL